MAYFTKHRMQILFQCLILYICFVSGNSDTCVKKGPCRCEYENGTAVDLDDSNDNNVYATSISRTNDVKGWDMIFYYFHPCKAFKFQFNDSVKNECQSTSVCLRKIEMHNVNNTYTAIDGGYIDRGSINTVSFVSGESGNSIVYNVDLNTVTTILLVCVKGGNTLAVTDPNPSNLLLTLYSPKACAFGGGATHHSLGTTLLIVVFVLALVYLIAGCLVKRFLMGAQGIEIIPNLSFWRELPNLVKDGMAFVSNGFKPPAQSTNPGPGPNPNPNSYDSI